MSHVVPYVVIAMLISTTAMAGNPESMIERGRYLVEIGGCNECHSPGYEDSHGQMPESAWLQGSAMGFSGPWGVSYPANLRLMVTGMQLEDWLKRIDTGGLPPMPWLAVQAMSTEDRTAIFRFVQSLGPAGEWAPVAQGPGEPIRTQHIPFIPQGPDASVVQAAH